MSRLSIVTQNNAQKTVEDLYKDLERRITASQPGLCPVDLQRHFYIFVTHSPAGNVFPAVSVSDSWKA